MHKKEKFVENKFTWPICKKLLFLVLEDKVSDVFVCELVWERLFYKRDLTENDSFSNDNKMLPKPCKPPVSPAKGHFGDPEIE